MASIQELIGEIHSIKETSEELSTMVGAASQSLEKQGVVIVNLVQGSRTGQEAVAAMTYASKGLADAAVSMRTLGRTCDSCLQDLTK